MPCSKASFRRSGDSREASGLAGSVRRGEEDQALQYICCVRLPGLRVDSVDEEIDGVSLLLSPAALAKRYDPPRWVGSSTPLLDSKIPDTGNDQC